MRSSHGPVVPKKGKKDQTRLDFKTLIAIFTAKHFTMNDATPTYSSYCKCCNNVTGCGVLLTFTTASYQIVQPDLNVTYVLFLSLVEHSPPSMSLLWPCPTPGLIRLLRSHRSSTAQLQSRITYSGHSHAVIPPLSTTLGLIPIQSLLHLTVYPALTWVLRVPVISFTLYHFHRTWFILPEPDLVPTPVVPCPPFRLFTCHRKYSSLVLT